MMTSIESYVHQGRHTLRKLLLDPRFHRFARGAVWTGAGFVLSAASLSHSFLPLSMGLVCAVSGWPAVLTALGGGLGYLLFWGGSALQGLLWLVLALPCALLLGDKRIARDTPLLLPALAALIVSASGVFFQNWMADDTSVPIYLLRVGLGTVTARLFAVVLERRDPILDWLACGVAILALAQVAPVPFLGLGFLAAGALGTAGAFPAAALAGLALDLAQVTKVPMAAVLSLAYFTRLIPWTSRRTVWAGPAVAYIAVCALCSAWDMAPLPGLILGGALGLLLPAQAQAPRRRGETGVAQVRLEMAAACLSQTQQVLMEAAVVPIDEGALITRAVERACGGCPCRKTCREREAMSKLPPPLLHRPLLNEGDLPMTCRKPGRMLLELRRCQEQLRSLQSERERQEECREAVIQQYHFLSGYLRDLSDLLSRRAREPKARFQAQVAVCANRPEADNGDRCVWFAGTECRYYVLLCDGMGTGLGAIDEGNTAARLLRKLLSAGFPAEHALRSLNSLCALRNRAGAVTVDLAEIHLDSGRTALYKWGAAPSYLVTQAGAEKIGTAGPPPGLSVTEGRETVERLSLRRGETLVLLSDGVGGEDARFRLVVTPEAPPGEVAASFLECGEEEATDDATAVAIRLVDLSLATS